MSTENAIKDENNVSAILWQSSSDPTETMMIRVNPANWAIQCEVAI